MTVFKDRSEQLGKGEENLIFGASIGKATKQSDRFFEKTNRMATQEGFKIRIIFNEDVRGHKERTEYFEKSKLHELRYLYQNTFTELNLYKDTVNIIMLFEKPIVIRVRNKEAADSFRTFFEGMWKTAKP